MFELHTTNMNFISVRSYSLGLLNVGEQVENSRDEDIKLSVNERKKMEKYDCSSPVTI